MPKWHKQGRIFHLEPAPGRSTHTQVPTALVKEHVVRLYYSCRNKGKSFVAYIDLERKDLSKVVHRHDDPVLSHGEPGMFDSDGVMPSCIIEFNRQIWLYYIGWNARADGARYHNEIGLAVSNDGGETFERKFLGPIMSRDKCEPGLAVMPYIIHDRIWHCWYQSGVRWESVNGVYEPIYVIKYAHSLDGINWKRHPEQCVQSRHPLEAFSRPSVRFAGGTYHAWYCYRGSADYRDGTDAYRIGYAQSKNGRDFLRCDQLAGIDVGDDGAWDSKQICYPAVVEIDGRLIMFYNGNGFGQSGIGWAVYDD